MKPVSLIITFVILVFSYHIYAMDKTREDEFNRHAAAILIEDDVLQTLQMQQSRPHSSPQLSCLGLKREIPVLTPTLALTDEQRFINGTLWNACEALDPQNVILALQAGAHPDALVLNGNNTLLMTVLRAIENRAQLDTVRQIIGHLLSARADTNFKNSLGYTALHFAAGFDDLGIIMALLGSGAQKTVQNISGAYPYDYSSNKDVRMLLFVPPQPYVSALPQTPAIPKLPAQPQPKAPVGETNRAQSNGLKAAVITLEIPNPINKQAAIPVLSPHEFAKPTAPIQTLQPLRREEMFSPSPAPESVVDQNLDWPPLLIALRQQFIDSQRSGDAVQIRAAGVEFLCSAVYRGNKVVAEDLINKGAPLDVLNQQGMLPLHRAVMGNHVDIVLLLLEKGASINGLDALDNTALHLAAGVEKPNAALLKLFLMDKGCNKAARNKAGETFLDKCRFLLRLARNIIAAKEKIDKKRQSKYNSPHSEPVKNRG